MKQKRVFDEVADIYDIEATSLDDIGFYLGLAGEAGYPVLELGAGTGRVSIELAKAGFEVKGLVGISLFAPSYQKLEGPWTDHMSTLDTQSGTITRIEKVTPDHVRQLIHVERVYDWTDAQGKVTSRIWNFSLRYLWRFEAELLLEKAGLEVEAIYGDYQRGEFRHDGEMLFVAKKEPLRS